MGVLIQLSMINKCDKRTTAIISFFISFFISEIMQFYINTRIELRISKAIQANITDFGHFWINFG